jgi:UDP-N-acetylmuramyl pentapeptide phosphotransferase/UDP-N-acetylglucosamine-1-phosphate transferase
VLGFGGYALLGAMAGAGLFTLLCLVLAGAAAGFLLFNFPRARIFMGDAGSSTLGFLAAAFALWADRDGLFPLWVAVLVFSPFFVDATVTLLRRALKGEKVWEAHRSHFYQRLVLLGWSHRRTVLWEYVLMAACVVSAALAVSAPPAAQLGIVAGWILVYAALMAGVARLEDARRADRRGRTA